MDNNQPSTIIREHRNPIVVSYTTALQRETEHGSTTQNVATTRQTKRQGVVIYN